MAKASQTCLLSSALFHSCLKLKICPESVCFEKIHAFLSAPLWCWSLLSAGVEFCCSSSGFNFMLCTQLLNTVPPQRSDVHCRPVECPPDYVFDEYDRPRARRHGAQDRRTRCPSRAFPRLHAQLTKLSERCLFYYAGHSHRDIVPGKSNRAHELSATAQTL